MWGTGSCKISAFMQKSGSGEISTRFGRNFCFLVKVRLGRNFGFSTCVGECQISRTSVRDAFRANGKDLSLSVDLPCNRTPSPTRIHLQTPTDPPTRSPDLAKYQKSVCVRTVKTSGFPTLLSDRVGFHWRSLAQIIAQGTSCHAHYRWSDVVPCSRR